MTSSSVSNRFDPNGLGYVMPAEWEPHESTWTAWPHNHETWPRNFGEVERFFALMVSTLLRFEDVHVLVQDHEHERAARRWLGQSREGFDVSFHTFPTNDAWCRDYGATFVCRNFGNKHFPPRLAIEWQFNSWGNKYPPYDLDNAVSGYMARKVSAPQIAGGLVLEGGAIDVDGQGTVMATKSSILNDNRNPDFDQTMVDDLLCRLLGTTNVIWLPGELAGDDTDGHIDQLARFVAPGRIAAVDIPDAGDENHGPLAAMWQRLNELVEEEPSLEAVKLPAPPKLYEADQRLPASYANFYLVNGAVLVPQFGTSDDAVALEQLNELFPNRQVIGLDCSAVVRGLGSIHCLTQQVPAPPAEPTS